VNAMTDNSSLRRAYARWQQQPAVVIVWEHSQTPSLRLAHPYRWRPKS